MMMMMKMKRMMTRKLWMEKLGRRRRLDSLPWRI